MTLLRPKLQTAVIAIVQVLAISTWLSATAAAPGIEAESGLDPARSVWLTAAVQVGFVVGAVAAALLGLADRIRPTLLMATGSGGAAVCTFAIALLPAADPGVFVLRVLTGVCLANVYPIGLKLVSSWSPPFKRGRAYGVMLASLTVGTALPQLIRGVESIPWRGILIVAAIASLLAAALSLSLVRQGPHQPIRASRLDLRYAARLFRSRGPRLANLGYYGHMWELYAFWTWLPLYLLASGLGGGDAGTAVWSFLLIGGAGAVGALAGGWLADRIGRSAAAGGALAVSGACALLAPVIFFLPRPLGLAVLALWCAAVIADSGVFSTALSETAQRDRVGTALTVQTAIGFALTVPAILLVGALGAHLGWQWAYLVLVPGPVLGVIAMVRFGSWRRSHSKEKNMNWSERTPSVGQVAELSRTVTGDDIDYFTRISGDHNPLHYDQSLADASRFGGIIVQGGVTSAILNAVVAEKLPGPGTVFLSVNWNFEAPVRPGDTITGRVIVTSVRDDKPITSLETSVVTQDGTVVLSGTAVCYTVELAEAS